MAILEKEIKIKLSGRNIEHCENLGYSIPRVKKNGRTSVKNGTEISVSVEHLLKGVRTEVTKIKTSQRSHNRN